MAATGYKYFYDFLGLDVGSVRAAFDFREEDGIRVPSEIWTTQATSGELNDDTNFYESAGSGQFDGSKYIELASGIPFNDWTAFVVYERSENTPHVLFSSLEGEGSSISGSLVGINESNRLFFENYDNVIGPQIFTFDNILPSKNISVIRKSANSVSFFYFNPNSKELESSDKILDGGSTANSNTWFVGGSPNLPDYIDYSGFSGFLDNFILVDTDLASSDIVRLCSGFYAEKTPDTTTETLFCKDLTFITSQPSGIASGELGFEVSLDSSVSDACGRVRNTYTFNSVTGIISGYRFVPIFTDGCEVITGFIDQGFGIDRPFLDSLGMESVATLIPWEDDVLEFNATTGLFEDLFKNLQAGFNVVTSRFFVDQEYDDSNELNVFTNGILQIDSGFSTAGSQYVISGDFFISGDEIVSTGFYTTNDHLVFDRYEGDFLATRATDIASGDSIAINPQERRVYVNGQKLIRDRDFEEIGGETVFLYGFDGENTVVFLDKESNIEQVSDISGFIEAEHKFLRRSSKTYLNGIRLTLGVGYVEHAGLDLLAGNVLIDNTDGTIYNNTNDFFN